MATPPEVCLAHLLEASQAMIAPHTASEVRQRAGQYLEAAMDSPQTWDLCCEWLAKMTEHLEWSQTTHATMEARTTATSMLLLCLQLLQTKIRRQLVRHHHDHSASVHALGSIHQQLGALATKQEHDKTVRSSVCITLAALSLRCSGSVLSDTVEAALSAQALPPMAALQLLLNIPLEVELLNLTPTQGMAELAPFLNRVLQAMGLVVLQQPASGELVALAMETLQNWIRVCRVTLSQLLVTMVHQTSLLQLLIQILSQHSNIDNQVVFTFASHCLSEATRQLSDEGTDARAAALHQLFASIDHGFLRNPLHLATSREWDDACLALADCTCTLVTESIDELAALPAESLLRLLLDLQLHSLAKVRMNMLEVWLTVQEVPTNQRHEHWKGALYHQVVQAIVQGIAFPSDFVNWQESIEDESEFDEYRRLCQDILSSAYFLQRKEYVASHVSTVLDEQSAWYTREAALYALTSTARDVCGRIKGHGGGSSVVADREQTKQLLVSLVRRLALTDHAVEAAAAHHPQFLVALVGFVGSYAPIWQLACSPDELLSLLTFLETALRTSAPAVLVAKAICSLLVGLKPSIFLAIQPQGSGHVLLLDCMQKLMSMAAQTRDSEAMEIVTEGCTRFVADSEDDSFLYQGLGQLAESLLNHANLTMQEFAVGMDPTAYNPVTSEKLVCYMHCLQVVIRFGDNGSSSSKSEMSEIVQLILPFLESLTRLLGIETVLEAALAIHEQLLQNFPDIMAASLDQTVKYIYGIFELTFHPGALRYVLKAVEVYAAAKADLFLDAFTHMARFVMGRLDTNDKLLESAAVAQAFFELLERFVIYCPAGLVPSEQFPSLVAFVVDCLAVLQGEREATRAALNFLGKLFGWRLLRLSPETEAYFKATSRQVDGLLYKHGAQLTQICMTILLGGPQMLWPACSECLFVIEFFASTWPLSDGVYANVAEQWLQSVVSSGVVDKSTYMEAVSMLLQLLNDGPKNKPRAKMLLTDFSKVHRGEVGQEVLFSYRNVDTRHA